MMTRDELRAEMMEPTINRVRHTLLPFVAECALAAADAPTLDAYMAAGARLARSRSPIADAFRPFYLRQAWLSVDAELIAERWVRLR
jgi:hypothetical protein